MYKLNKVYVHPKMSLSLDKGTIDLELIDALKQWSKIYVKHEIPYITLRREMYDNEYLNLPITVALFEENVTFFNKYFKRVHFADFIYNAFNMQALNYLTKNKLNTFWKKAYFNLYYYPIKGFKFSFDHFAIGQVKYLNSFAREGWDFTSKDWIFGSNLKWDVPHELYKGNKIQSFYFRTYQSTTNLH